MIIFFSIGNFLLFRNCNKHEKGNFGVIANEIFSQETNYNRNKTKTIGYRTALNNEQILFCIVRYKSPQNDNATHFKRENKGDILKAVSAVPSAVNVIEMRKTFLKLKYFLNYVILCCIWPSIINMNFSIFDFLIFFFRY